MTETDRQDNETRMEDKVIGRKRRKNNDARAKVECKQPRQYRFSSESPSSKAQRKEKKKKKEKVGHTRCFGRESS